MYHQIRWTLEKLKQRLALIEPLVYRREHTLAPFRFLALDDPLDAPPVEPGLDDSGWEDIPSTSYWGGPNMNFVLRSRFTLPADWERDRPAALFLPLGVAGDFSHPEALAYVDGTPFAACDRHHQEIKLPEQWCDSAEHALALHGWTGGTQRLRFGVTSDPQPESFEKLLMRPCQIVQIDQPIRDFIALARVALGAAGQISEDNPARGHLLNALDAAFIALDTRDPLGEAFYASLPAARQILQEGIERSGPPLDVDVTAVGHAHIDVAWLWTLGQTRRKAGRTFHTVLHLMAQFPGYRFVQSQPQLYDYVRQDYPDLFEAIKSQVAAGQWEPIGGMWVEADCNLSGGESLARQFLLGRDFFRQHFGPEAESPVLWLPDVFGYAWNLPQLIKEAGLDYFFTIKIGWSQYNRFPYDSFWWQGLDGTRVLTHFSPTKDHGSDFASTYNSTVSPSQVLGTWSNFLQKDWGQPGQTPPLLLAYGYGDGGGGPTREMLENIRELKNFPAMPRTGYGTVAEFFRHLESSVGERLPTWNGELYLEYHRGTYTTQARNKRANRKSEFLLHDADFLAAFAAALGEAASGTHQADLRRAWELVCLNQFHDIIPGSSIGPVYVESLRQYDEVRALGEAVRQAALEKIARKLEGQVLLVNPTSFARRDLTFLPRAGQGASKLQRADGRPVAVQATDAGWLLDAGELPPYSVTPLAENGQEQVEQPPAGPLIVNKHLLENDFLRVEFDAAGDIVRITDKVNDRDVLSAHDLANQFQAFEDRPKTPDAWEIDIYYDDRMWLADPATSVEVVEAGPLRATLEIRRRIFASDIVQRISLSHYNPRLDFDTVVQWRERHTMLKVAFPVNVLAPTATYEIQFGNVERPTHRNTSWDWARFETAAQKWVDLSEGDYGVSLLNDCKYGHDIRDNVIRLTLLRSPTDPDPTADLGEQRFSYSLLPHAGRWDERTVAAAYALNDPVVVWNSECRTQNAESGEVAPALGASLVSVDQPNVVIETVKAAEDGEGLIVRLYESQRRRGPVTLTAGFPLAAAWRTNLLEENQEPLAVAGRSLSFSIRPYQIVTLRLLA